MQQGFRRLRYTSAWSLVLVTNTCTLLENVFYSHKEINFLLYVLSV
jgi:hypothetical protein